MKSSMSATKIGVIAATISLVILLGVGVCLNGTNRVFASESNAKRYSDGYNNGFNWYASHPNDGANNCDPDKLYTSDGTHTDTYCNGWAAGYTDASNSGSGNSGTQQGQSSNVNIHGNNNKVQVNQGQANNPNPPAFSPDGGDSNGNHFGGSNPGCRIICIS